MSLRSFDVVVFGATGFIGQEIVKYIHANQIFTKWAVLGRNHKKLSELISELNEIRPNKLPDILIADAQDVGSLRDIFMETRLLINCVSPVSLYKDIIEACMMARCDYMDLCCDMKLIESDFLEFHIEAQKKGVTIIHGCAFDPAIAELGVLLARNICGNDGCHVIESFLKIDAPKGYNFQRSLDFVISNAKNYHKIKQIQTKIHDKYKPLIMKHPGPRVECKRPYYFEKKLNYFAIPNLTNEKQLIDFSFKTQLIQNKQNNTNHKMTFPQYYNYYITENYYDCTIYAFYSTLLTNFSQFKFGKFFLKNYFFDNFLFQMKNHSNKLTSIQKEQIENTKFSMIFIAKGFLQKISIQNNELRNSTSNEFLNSSIENISEISDNNSEMSFLTNPSVEIIDKNSVNATFCSADIQTNCSIFNNNLNINSNYYKIKSSNNHDVQHQYTTELNNYENYEKWIRINGPDPFYTTSVIVTVKLAQFYLNHKLHYTFVNSSGGVYDKFVNNNEHVKSTSDVPSRVPDTPSRVSNTPSLPFGGVFTPSGIFANFPMLFDHLSDAGIEFTFTSEIEENERSMKEYYEKNKAKQDSEEAITRIAEKANLANESNLAAGEKVEPSNNTMVESSKAVETMIKV